MDNDKAYTCSNWAAVKAGEDLLVYGACTFPTPGWSAELRYANPGINPDPTVLALELVATGPSHATPAVDIVPQVLTPSVVVLQTNAAQAKTVSVRRHANFEIRDIAPEVNA